MTENYTTAGRWVVGTDGSSRSDKAVMWAAKRVSERTTPVPLLILHAITESPIPSAAQQDRLEDNIEKTDARRAADQIVQDVAAKVREAYPDLDLETAVVLGHPADVLATAAADADQVVVGAPGLSTSALVRMLGVTSDHVVANAQGSVAVVPEQAEEREGGPVVVGLDDTEQGRLAIARAFQAASLRGVPLIAVRAWGRGTPDDGAESAAKEAERLIADQVAEFSDVTVTIETPRQRPEEVLVEASRTAGLVVIGSQGRGGFTGLRLGPTTRHVLRQSYCPVVVTRTMAGWADHRGRDVGVAAH